MPEPRKSERGFADFAEPFCAGWIARREQGEVEPEEFARLLMDAFENSGPERARRLVEAMEGANDVGARRDIMDVFRSDEAMEAFGVRRP